MNQQELFNKAYIGVTKQGSPATGIFGSCEYRVDSNMKMCAFGHVMNGTIDDKSPIWNIEGDVKGIQMWLHCNPTKELDWLLTNKDMISLAISVQDSHDNADRNFFMYDFQIAMKRVANKFQLTIPNVEENE